MLPIPEPAMGGAETIKLKCPNLRCRKVLSAPATARGQVVRCKHCMTHLRVPMASGAGERPASPPKAGA